MGVRRTHRDRGTQLSRACLQEPVQPHWAGHRDWLCPHLRKRPPPDPGRGGAAHGPPHRGLEPPLPAPGQGPPAGGGPGGQAGQEAGGGLGNAAGPAGCGAPALPRSRDLGRGDPGELQGPGRLVADALGRAGPEAGVPPVLLPAHAVLGRALRGLLLHHRPRADPGADRHARPRDQAGAGGVYTDQGQAPGSPGEALGALPEGGGEPPAHRRPDGDRARGASAPARPELLHARPPHNHRAAGWPRLLRGGDGTRGPRHGGHPGRGARPPGAGEPGGGRGGRARLPGGGARGGAGRTAPRAGAAPGRALLAAPPAPAQQDHPLAPGFAVLHPRLAVLLAPGLLAAAEAAGGGATFDQELLRDIPSSGSPWSLLETVEATAILDRIENGGLYVGEAGLLGVHGSSWTQVTYRLGNLDITDPGRTGTPLLQPELFALQKVTLDSFLMPVEDAGPGATLRLFPRRPRTSRRGTLSAAAVPLSSQPPPAHPPPPR